MTEQTQQNSLYVQTGALNYKDGEILLTKKFESSADLSKKTIKTCIKHGKILAAGIFIGIESALTKRQK